MSVCERCGEDYTVGVHGWLRCPLEPREMWNSTFRDKAFYFTTVNRVPGTEIRSPGQWKRFLKQHNLTDDLTLKDHQDMVSRGYAEKKRKDRVEKLKQEVRKIVEEHAYESIVYKH